MVKKVLSIFVLFVCLLTSNVFALEVIRVTPSGEEVKNAAEVVIQFDKAVAPLGDPSYKTELFENAIQPRVSCDWRWIAPETVSCRLKAGETFAPATRYTITVPVSGLSDEEREPYGATFTTLRPRVVSNYEDSWKSPVLPTFYIRTNIIVDANELEKVLSFVSQEKEFQIDAKLDTDGDKLGFYITPKQDLPYDSEVSLKIVPGLKATSGVELGIQNEILRNFRTFGDFKLLGIACQSEEGKEVIVYDADAEVKCNPLSGFGLAFSAPVRSDDNARFSVTPSVYTKEKEQQFFEDLYTSELHQTVDDTHKNVFYTLKTNWLIPASKVYSVRVEKGSFTDIFERPLKEVGVAGFQTGKRQKRIVFDHQFSVLEKGVESHVPIFMTNIKELKADYTINTVKGRFLGKKIYNGYPVEDLSYRYPIKVRDLLGTANSESGIIEGNLSTPETKYNEWFFSEVTPFHVHVKLGHFSSLVWVTDFESGEAVSNADVTLLSDKLKGYGLKQQKLASAKTDANGIAILPGLETIDPEHSLLDSWKVNEPMIITKVSKGGDLAVVPSVYRFRVYPNVGLWEKEKYGHIRAWGTTTQGIYRAGDSIKYKIFVRNQDNNTLTKAPVSGYTLQLIDPMGDLVSEVKDVKLSEFGSFSGEFETAKSAPSGIYRIVLKAAFAEKFSWDALTVLISDFTKAPFKVQNTVENKVYEAGDDLDFKVEARLHAGGPFAKAPLKINAFVNAKEIRPKDKKFNAFSFDPASEKDEDGNEISPWGIRTLHKEDAVLDGAGNFDGSFDVPETTVAYGTLILESSVQDSRGKDVAARSLATYAARNRYVGLRQNDWIFTTGQEHAIESIVIDQNGEVAEGTPISVKIKQLDRKAARVKSAGNAYVTKYVEEWNEIYECKGISSAEPFVCKFVPSKSAIYEISAEIKDQEDRPFKTELRRFAFGGDFVLWGSDSNPDLEMSSDKNEYRIGDTAKILIKNPYPNAKALFTIERYGVKRHWTKTIEGSSEIVEVPVTAADLPGFYLSVVVMSPRIADKPIDENQVDLGKPAFKMGYVQINVTGDAKRLVTTVTPKQESYKPRETAEVEINVKDNEGNAVSGEVAVIALDEAVFDLLKDGMNYFDPYKGFYKLESLDVVNLNIIESLIGRIAFEKKGAVPAGDGLGGKVDERDEFVNVAYWNPALRLDPSGYAKIQFKLPDNLTSWRVIAISTDATDKMGVGFNNLKVNLPLEARFALPNQVRDGDEFNVKAVVMNRTEEEKELHAVLSVKQGENVKESELNIDAKPFIQNKIEVPFKVSGYEPVTVHVKANTADDSDATSVKLEVARSESVEKQSFYGSLGKENENEKVIKLKFPKDIKQDIGGLMLVASNSLIGSMEGTFKAMRDYPYPCWEQKLSRAVSAAMYLRLKNYLPASFKWEVSPAEIIAEASNFQAPNGGMAFFVAKDEYVSEYLSAYTALAFKWLKDLGYTVPDTINGKLKEYLKVLLRRDSGSVNPSLRAIIVEALSNDKELAKDEFSRLMMQREKLNLMGLASLLSVAVELNDPGKDTILGQIMNASDETSGKLTFRDEGGLALHSSIRSSCAVLNALLMTSKDGPTYVDDLIQKLVRSISYSKRKDGAWLNTQENVFCSVAMEHYSRLYETATVAETIDFNLDNRKISTLKLSGTPGSTVEFSRPFSEGDEGKDAELKISLASKTGRAYFVAGMEYALNKSLPAVNAGFDIVREYSKVSDDGRIVLLSAGDSLEVGDRVRVDLFVTTSGAHSYVALNDPLPSAFETVNTDLATAATLTDNEAISFDSDSFFNKFSDWNEGWYFYHKELKHEAVRFFADRLPAGRYHLSYTVQVIASGQNFRAPAATVEEMYSPDVFGRGEEFILSVNDVNE